jgi:hydroxypyruvate isomerase
MKFDINCSILLTGLPLLERPGAARALGFDAVEFWWPFAEAVPADRDVDAFVAALADAGVRLAALNFAAGDMAAGERGLLSHPDRSAEFRDSVDEPNLGLLADVYHLARMGEDIAAALADPRLAHVQFADVPGRGAPGTGTLDFEILLRQLAAQDYRGHIGYEFVHNDAPLTPTTFLWR